MIIVKDSADGILRISGTGYTQLKKLPNDVLELTIDHLRITLEPEIDELGLPFIKLVQHNDERQLALFKEREEGLCPLIATNQPPTTM